MNISEGFIKRPIATSLLMAAIALFGLVAYRSLPVSDLPNVDFPTITVSAKVPYSSLFGAIGLGSVTLNLNAKSEAAVIGA